MTSTPEPAPRIWLILDVLLDVRRSHPVLGMDDQPFSTGTLVAASLLYALVPAIVLAALLGAIAYAQTVRGARIRTSTHPDTGRWWVRPMLRRPRTPSVVGNGIAL